MTTTPKETNMDAEQQIANEAIANDTEAFLQRMRARPMTHEVVTTFADGTKRRFKVQSIGAANNHAVGERRKIGRDLISRGDDLGHKAGDIVRVVSVEIAPL
jgi:hypothetical protein